MSFLGMLHHYNQIGGAKRKQEPILWGLMSFLSQDPIPADQDHELIAANSVPLPREKGLFKMLGMGTNEKNAGMEKKATTGFPATDTQLFELAKQHYPRDGMQQMEFMMYVPSLRLPLSSFPFPFPTRRSPFNFLSFLHVISPLLL
jgi:hypothetical protein